MWKTVDNYWHQCSRLVDKMYLSKCDTCLSRFGDSDVWRCCVLNGSISDKLRKNLLTSVFVHGRLYNRICSSRRVECFQTEVKGTPKRKWDCVGVKLKSCSVSIKLMMLQVGNDHSQRHLLIGQGNYILVCVFESIAQLFPLLFKSIILQSHRRCRKWFHSVPRSHNSGAKYELKAHGLQGFLYKPDVRAPRIFPFHWALYSVHLITNQTRNSFLLRKNSEIRKRKKKRKKEKKGGKAKR